MKNWPTITVLSYPTIDFDFYHFYRLFILFCLFGPLVLAGEYVPGTPGAPWSMDEVLAVKAKLYGIFSTRGQSFTAGAVPRPQPFEKWFLWASAAKALRLGFHDCLKYKGG